MGREPKYILGLYSFSILKLTYWNELLYSAVWNWKSNSQSNHLIWGFLKWSFFLFFKNVKHIQKYMEQNNNPYVSITQFHLW